MPAFAGRTFAASILIAGSYQPLAGLRTRSLTIGNSNIDVTTADSSGQWRELLPSGGVKNLDFEAAGVWQGDVTGKNTFVALVGLQLVTLRIVQPGAIQFDGQFQVDNFQFTNPFNQEVGFTARFMSSGPITIAYS
jgi:TP901-1 family phage major tail protein